MWRAARCQPISDARSEIKKIMVPRERIELSRSKAPRDFKFVFIGFDEVCLCRVSNYLLDITVI